MRLFDSIRSLTRSGATGPATYAVTFLLVLGCLVARTALGPWVTGRSPLLPFVAAVVLSAGLYGIGPGIFAIVLSLLLAVAALLLPHAAPPGPDDVAAVALFIVVSAAMLVFADHLRSARRRALLLEGELQQVQTAAAMSTMAGTLAHELNQPLTAASNYLAASRQFVKQIEAPGHDRLLSGLDRAEDQIQRAGSIIREARSLLRNLPVERAQTWLRPLIDRVIEVARANKACGNVQFEVGIAADAARAPVNAVQLEQVLLNLVRNAWQAMQFEADPRISLVARRAEGGTLIELRDNGPGIPRDQLPGLFSSARRPAGRGLGVGLSICRTIVEAHGGSIMAHNHPDGGAAFLILLPDDPDS